jgi:hypothetical protein
VVSVLDELAADDAVLTCDSGTIPTWAPGAVVNVVPPLADDLDQCVVHALPFRRTRAAPDPTLWAYGGGLPYSRNRDVRTVVCWITTVPGDSRPPSVVTAGFPSIETSQRPFAGDQVKRNEGAG